MAPVNALEVFQTRLEDYVATYERILFENMRMLVERFEGDPSYPFINTKVSIITGEDFKQCGAGRPIYASDLVYGWGQGRGLETVAGCLRWLPTATTLADEAKHDLALRLQRLLEEAVASAEALRQRNDGRMFFIMTLDGQPMEVDDQGEVRPVEAIPGQANYSDLFYSKGLFAAARYLGREDLAAQAMEYFRLVVDAIEQDGFITDQQQLDPKNKVRPVPGKLSHGPRMISLGGIAEMIEATGDQAWIEAANRKIRYIADKHINRGKFADLEPWDFVEFIDPEGRPWNDAGAVLCDPGHTLEFVGLACGTGLAAKRSGQSNDSFDRLMAACEEIMPNVFARAFELGFNKEQGGIYKTVDLLTREPRNSDMPWWSLPETMRGAARMLALYPSLDPGPIVEAYALCHDALVNNYINEDVYCMAYETRSADGQPVDVIPGTPDADPSYHTGLSLLGVLELRK